MKKLVKQFCIPGADGEPTGLKRALDGLLTRPPPRDKDEPAGKFTMESAVRLLHKNQWRIAKLGSESSKWANWTDLDLKSRRESLEEISAKVQGTLKAAGEELITNFEERFPDSGVWWGMGLFAGATMVGPGTLNDADVDERVAALHCVQATENAVDLPVYREQVRTVRRELRKLHLQAFARNITDEDERDMVPAGARAGASRHTVVLALPCLPSLAIRQSARAPQG